MARRKDKLTSLERKIVQDRFGRKEYCAACGGEIIFYGQSARDLHSGRDTYEWERRNRIHRSCWLKKQNQHRTEQQP